MLIIGGGVCGTAIARQLSRYNLKLALLEGAADVATGATKANSAIVHGGYAEAHTTLKGRLCYPGRTAFAALNQQLNFGFKPIGSMVLAFEEEQLPKLQTLLENGRQNGLPDLAILNRSQILEKEPGINPAVKYALYCEGAGVCSPFEYAIALAENAVQNGLELFLSTAVTGIEKTIDGFTVTTNTGRSFKSRYVVNAAGLQSGQVSAMVGVDDFTVHPRSGEYILLRKGSGALVNSVLFQMPTKMGKGILVTPTVYGNLLIGPDAIDEQSADRGTHAPRLHAIYTAALQTAPALDITQFLRSFAGVRPVSSTDDFVIGETRVKGFINVAGIQSPGLTASPAIAAMVQDILQQNGLVLTQKPNFNPNRRPTYTPHATLPASELTPLLNLPQGAPGRMLCRCEQIPEAALQDAITRGIPVTTADAVKRRIRAGMGFCGGTFCRPRTAAIMAQQPNITFDPRTDIERDGIKRVTRQQMLDYIEKAP
ncbi:NAD(P)/FAD-dependent oxidoreductase [Ruminococcaceae bacterium OttesenSCG-928-A16]|nr:NAD(P)/FAD-dependent oxidoreductase [Ruminococcaceae bacterium OttesenSCG-928-A16]